MSEPDLTAMSMDLLFADLQVKYPEEVYCQEDIDVISNTLRAAGISIAVDIAVACQSDSECREILGELDDDNRRNIMKKLATVARPYLLGWRSTTVRRALARSASDESDVAVPSSSVRECDGVTQGEQNSNIKYNDRYKRPVSEVAIVKQTEKFLKLMEGEPIRKHQTERPTHCVELSHLTQKEDQWKTEYKHCFELLRIIGDISPRQRELTDCNAPPGIKSLVEDVFRAGCQDPASVAAKRKEATTFVAWCKALALAAEKKGAPTNIYDLDKLTPTVVSTYIRDQRARGSTVPPKVWDGLLWVQSVSGLQLHVQDPLVKNQKNPVERTAFDREPTPAEMATEDELRAMEDYTVHGETPVERVYGGFLANLGHGTLRWKDAQFSRDLVETKDAIVGTGAIKKRGILKWASLKAGLNGENWGGVWLNSLKEFGMPRKDFVLLAPNNDFDGFIEQIATYNDAVNVQRYLMMKSARLGYTAEQALCKALHSWRHLYNTAARQLGVDPQGQEKIGHWAKGSSMPETYDSRGCVVELKSKTTVLNALQKGWQVADEGCVPEPHPDNIEKHAPPKQSLVCDWCGKLSQYKCNECFGKLCRMCSRGCNHPHFSCNGVFCPSHSTIHTCSDTDTDDDDDPCPILNKKKKVAKTSKKDKKLKKEETVNLNEELRHVVNLDYHMVHVWRKGDTTLCNHWVCGSPDQAEGPPFGRSLDYIRTPMMMQQKKPVMKKLGWCKRCHSQQIVIDKLDEMAMMAMDEEDDKTLGVISEINRKCSKGNSVALLPIQTTRTSPSKTEVSKSSSASQSESSADEEL